jgi:hypothetical protein
MLNFVKLGGDNDTAELLRNTDKLIRSFHKDGKQLLLRNTAKLFLILQNSLTEKMFIQCYLLYLLAETYK